MSVEYPEKFPYQGKLASLEFWAVCSHCRGEEVLRLRAQTPALIPDENYEISRESTCGRIMIKRQGDTQFQSQSIFGGTSKKIQDLQVFCSLECGMRAYWPTWCLQRLRSEPPRTRCA